jgi:hypothetical protein
LEVQKPFLETITDGRFLVAEGNIDLGFRIANDIDMERDL